MILRNYIQLFRHFGEDLTGYISDDSSLSDLAIWEQIIKSRATIVKTYLKNKFRFSDVMFQTIPCVMFEQVEASECDLVPPSGCRISKSTCEIPNFLHLSGVSSQLGNESFDIVRWDQLQGKLNSRVDSIRNQTYVSVRNINGKQFMYIINDSFLENLVITAIAEDPVIFAQFCNDLTAKCDPLSLNIHTDADIQDAILKMTWDTIMKFRQTAQPDVQNNDLVG